MLRFLSVACAALVLSGCAAFNNLNNEVSTFGPWPADRKPASFVFERLPSQQVHPEHQIQLETAARGALEAAGFRAAADEASADYLMQIGARVTSNDPWIYNDPLFWRGGPRWGYGYGYGRWNRGWGPGWGPGWGYGGIEYTPTFEREVALLIRDRKTGQLLYEARASNTGPVDLDRLPDARHVRGGAERFSERRPEPAQGDDANFQAIARSGAFEPRLSCFP